MMLLSLIGASRRSAWWVVAVVPFESSSLSQLVQSSLAAPKSASEDLRIWDHFAGSRCSLQPTRAYLFYRKGVVTMGFLSIYCQSLTLVRRIAIESCESGTFYFIPNNNAAMFYTTSPVLEGYSAYL